MNIATVRLPSIALAFRHLNALTLESDNFSAKFKSNLLRPSSNDEPKAILPLSGRRYVSYRVLPSLSVLSFLKSFIDEQAGKDAAETAKKARYNADYYTCRLNRR